MNGFERRKEQKKQRILEASLGLFMTYGIQKVAVSEIAKDAHVSQVTIYNYFGSKDTLIQEVILFYVDKVWAEYEHLMDSDLPFPEKVKRSIFEKTNGVNQMSDEFFGYVMTEYTREGSYIEALWNEKVFPRLIEFFNEGKKQGYIDPSISGEAILVYMQMFTEYLRRDEIATAVLPLTEDLTKLFFYGIVGKNEE